MKNVLLLLPVLFALFPCPRVTAQTDAVAATITRDSLATTLNKVVRAFEVYHPNAYAYTDSATIADLRKDLLATLPPEIDTLTAFRALTRLTTAFNDAHSRVYAGRFTGYARARRFPRRLSVSGTTLSLDGRKVLTINDRPAGEIASTLRGYVNRETADLDDHILSRSFAYYYWLAYGEEDFRIRFADGEHEAFAGVAGAGGNENHARVPATSLTFRNNDSVAILRLRDFNDRPKTYRTAFAAAFDRIREAGATTLILDLRGHDGGDSRVGVELARYIADAPFRPFAYSEYRVTEALRQAFQQTYLPGILGTFKSVLTPFNPHLRAIYGSPLNTNGRVDYPLTKPYGPVKAFTGEVFLLQDEDTFSAGTCFTALVKDYGMGTIVGRPSGNLGSFHADALLKMPLPLGLSMRISTSYLVRPGGSTAAEPVQPDVLTAVGEDALEVALNQTGSASVQRM